MKVLVVSNDSGGAEIVSSWTGRNSDNQYSYILEGPAKRIFKRKVQGLENIDSVNLRSEIRQHDMVITGTSQNSNLEKMAIQVAKEESTTVATFLDYWVNFYNRFELDGRVIFPDEIWVTDEIASRNAKKELPESRIIIKGNPYIADLLEQKCSEVDNGEVRILYLCQPYDEDGFTEIQGLEYFFSLTKLANINKQVKIRIRVHPTEEVSKYRKVVKHYSKFFKIEIFPNNLLEDDLNWSQYAVGMHTNALVVAVEFGLKVYSCIPSNRKSCVLPIDAIQDYKSSFCMV